MFLKTSFSIASRPRRGPETTRKRSAAAREVHIGEIYAYFPFRLFGLDRSSLNELVEDEFGAELDLCRANPEMLRQYRDMKRAGHRVGFISDTYWNSEQLGRLLRSCSPELTWDFLYASCDHGSSKSEALFEKYLSGQSIDAATSFHVGDNENADVKGARRHGIRPRYYPQASAELASKLQREGTVLELLCPGAPSRLDHGARTLRRMAAAQGAEKSAAFHLGMSVLGPAMTAFEAFVDPSARLCQPGDPRDDEGIECRHHRAEHGHAEMKGGGFLGVARGDHAPQGPRAMIEPGRRAGAQQLEQRGPRAGIWRPIAASPADNSAAECRGASRP